MINNLDARVFNNLSASAINNLSARVLNNLDASAINNLDESVFNNLSARVISNLSARVISNLDALTKAKESLPVLEKPYTKIWQGIQEQKLKFDQSTWGDVESFETNICGTPMCTAGHLVHLAGKAGYKVKEEFNYPLAARLIHEKAHPGKPCQNFGAIPDEWALAYIESMAEYESTL